MDIACPAPLASPVLDTVGADGSNPAPNSHVARQQGQARDRHGSCWPALNRAGLRIREIAGPSVQAPDKPILTSGAARRTRGIVLVAVAPGDVASTPLLHRRQIQAPSRRSCGSLRPARPMNSGYFRLAEGGGLDDTASRLRTQLDGKRCEQPTSAPQRRYRVGIQYCRMASTTTGMSAWAVRRNSLLRAPFWSVRAAGGRDHRHSAGGSAGAGRG
jgi:hypothetical protein